MSQDWTPHWLAINFVTGAEQDAASDGLVHRVSFLFHLKESFPGLRPGWILSLPLVPLARARAGARETNSLRLSPALFARPPAHRLPRPPLNIYRVNAIFTALMRYRPSVIRRAFRCHLLGNWPTVDRSTGDSLPFVRPCLQPALGRRHRNEPRPQKRWRTPARQAAAPRQVCGR